MAITASGMYVNTFKKVFDATQLAFAYLADTCKVALFTNTITPDFSADTAYGVAPYNANEVSGTGYTAGGVALAGKTVTESPSSVLMFDATTDPSWTTATFSGARGALYWDDTLASGVADAVLCLQNFGGDFQVSAGTFTIQEPSAGIMTIDLY